MTVALERPAAAEQLGAFVAGLTLETLPAEVVEKVRCNLLHNLACAMAAHSVGAEAWALARGRLPAEATLICAGDRVPVEQAAFANAVLVHGRAQDDTHFAARCHAGAAVTPVALALAEARRLGGDRFIPALVAGYEVATSLGEMFALATTRRGFRSSMVFGTLGAAATAASLLGLDAQRTADAIAIATSFSGGLNEAWIEGSTEWRWELGMAARNGIVAAELAAAGAHGAPRAFEGAAGFVRAFTGDDAWSAPSDWELGSRWRLLDVIYKPYPVCNILQTSVALAIELACEYDLRSDDVAAMRCYLNPDDRSYPGTVNPGPYRDVGATLMSAQYCVAMALRDRTATMQGLRHFDDPELLALVARTDVLPDDALPLLATRLEIDTVDGRAIVREVIPDDATFGWTWDGVVANTKVLAAEMQDGEKTLPLLVARVSEIATVPSLGPLVEVLST